MSSVAPMPQFPLPLGQGPLNEWRARFDDGTYPDQFWEWLSDNMHILNAFVKLALRTQARGVERYSADGLCHVLRWRTEIRDRSQSAFKINNTYVAGLARLAMGLQPGLRGFFITRTPPGGVCPRMVS